MGEDSKSSEVSKEKNEDSTDQQTKKVSPDDKQETSPSTSPPNNEDLDNEGQNPAVKHLSKISIFSDFTKLHNVKCLPKIHENS